ncbi:MAG TPA: asparagine synthase (glutamine-hydrolyzing) [Baekduia sp.]|nr:asparagine synthase (glutamine-hydrolyzing) [Baekduia sp.]
MCGIAGIHDGAPRGAADEGVVHAMLDAIAHRGPDDWGLHVDGPVALGVRRLSIIDVAGGHQPIANEDGTIVVAYNGEIYNYRALRERLLRSGHTLRTHADTEVIAHLYEELGDDCVCELDGMFGFALWDARRRRLLLVRDRLGVKPLYWARAGGQLVFGSEIKALLCHPDLRARLDHDALAAFLLLKYVPAPQTMFAGVTALPPGHLLVADAGGVRVRRWWDVSFRRPEVPPDEEEAAELLRAALEEAVRSHLVSDVPFGAFLSGGVDSSLVVALMSRELRAPVRTFAVGFGGDGEDLSELPYARMVAERYETEHEEVVVGAGDLVALAEKVVWHLDQPIADNACLANYLVAELAARRVKMVLTGEGGDELFAGYARYAGERLAPVFGALPPRARALGVALSRRTRIPPRPRIALYALCQPEERRRFATWFALMSPAAREALAVGELADAVARAAPESLFAAALERADGPDRISRMLYVDTKLWLPDDLLARGDKMSMAASLEARVPLLDHRLVQFAASLPPEFKVKGLSRKYLLKKVARDLLPGPILDRPKKGFPIPMGRWLRGEAREFCRDLLAPETLRRRGLFAPAAVERLVDEHESGTAEHGAVLWALISVELWHRAFLDAPAPVAVAAASARGDAGVVGIDHGGGGRDPV